MDGSAVPQRSAGKVEGQTRCELEGEGWMDGNRHQGAIARLTGWLRDRQIGQHMLAAHLNVAASPLAYWLAPATQRHATLCRHGIDVMRVAGARQRGGGGVIEFSTQGGRA